MSISELASSVDAREMKTTDFYPHPSESNAYSLSQNEAPAVNSFPDFPVFSGGALVITAIFFMVLIFRTKSKRDALPVIPDKKPETQSEPDYFHLTLCVEGPADAEDFVLSSLASRVIREAENLYIPGINRRDSSDGEFAWSVQTKFPSYKPWGHRLLPDSGWFERPDVIERPAKTLCVCLQYTTQTPSFTLHSLVDEVGRQVAKAYLKGGHCQGSEGYTFCIGQS